MSQQRFWIDPATTTWLRAETHQSYPRLTEALWAKKHTFGNLYVVDTEQPEAMYYTIRRNEVEYASRRYAASTALAWDEGLTGAARDYLEALARGDTTWDSKGSDGPLYSIDTRISAASYRPGLAAALPAMRISSGALSHDAVTASRLVTDALANLIGRAEATQRCEDALRAALGIRAERHS